MKVGIAEIDFTPHAGLPIVGHIRDDYAATGVHDPLYSRAMVFADAAGSKAAIVVLDLLAITRQQTQFMREHISRHTSILPDNILIAATHTHGGPATITGYESPMADERDVEDFLRKAAQAVIIAAKNVKNVELRIGYAEETTVSFNRRLQCRDGTTHMNWEELSPDFVVKTHGPIDPRLAALCVLTDKRPQAAMVNFALHPAIIDYENSLYTGDYVGYLSEAMKKISGEDFTTLFANGCCGNINHINYADKDYPRRGYPMAQRVGYVLAAAVKKAMNSALLLQGDTVSVSREFVRLARFKVSQELYHQAQEYLSGKNKNNGKEEVDGLGLKYSAPLWVKMYNSRDEPDDVEVMVIRIGELAVVGLPGEVFCEFGMQIRRESPASHTMVIELANDEVWYLPTREAFSQGGYEVTPGATRYAPSSGEKVVESALKQLHTLFKK